MYMTNMDIYAIIQKVINIVVTICGWAHKYSIGSRKYKMNQLRIVRKGKEN